MMGNVERWFGDRTGRGVRIAVVDSGVHASHPHVGGVAGGVAILEGGGEGADYVDWLGHGTAVTAAIREKAPDAAVYAVKVFDRSLSTPVDCLIRAIEWAADRGVHLVNLSLGTTKVEHTARLQAVVLSACARGTAIVAAREHEGERWLPGGLPGVVPVLLDWDCPRDEYRATATAGADVIFRASGYPRDAPGIPRDRNLKGISFAVANMTGFAARALEGRPPTPAADLVRMLSIDD